jgi:RNA polymerase sigma-70 factor, ECF subfamily
VTSSSPALGLAFANESSVVVLAQAGDRRAFEELVNRRHASIRGLLRRLSRDAALADDLAQETFLQAWRRLSLLRTPATFGAWLRQVAINIWLQQVRSHESFSPLHDEDSGTDEGSAQTMTFDLEAALAHLAPPARLCVVLAYHEGMSHSEIASATQLPLGTVKSHVLRGAQQLRDLLQEYERRTP